MGMSSSVYTSKFLGTMELIEKQYGKGAPVNLSMLRNANVKREVKENIDEEDGEEDELVLCKETGTLFKADAKILNEILDLPQTVEFEKQQQENKEILKEEKIDEKLENERIKVVMNLLKHMETGDYLYVEKYLKTLDVNEASYIKKQLLENLRK